MTKQEPGKLVLEYLPPDEENPQGNFRWGITGHIPIPMLVGTLQLISSLLLDSQKETIMRSMQEAASKQIVLPNGRGLGLPPNL